MSEGALQSWRWLNTCLLMGSSELIACFALLAHASSALPIQLSLSHFYLSHCLPHPTAVERASGWMGLSCLLWLNHSSTSERVHGDPGICRPETKTSTLEQMLYKVCLFLYSRYVVKCLRQFAIF